MAVELWIDDGTPWWYLSTDIWVVSSDDPGDPPGMPYEGISAYVWARVHNRGTTPVASATVRYWWADPSTAITRATAHLIGTSSASLAAGETKEVLCLTPWIPEIVNDGHECLVVEVFAPGADPLAPHTPNDDFHVPTDRHVAQRNISVARAGKKMMLAHGFTIGNAMLAGRDLVHINVQRVELGGLKALLPQMGLAEMPKEGPEIEAFGVGPHRCGEPIEKVPETKLEIRIPRGGRQRMALIADIREPFPEGTAALFVVEQHDGEGRVVGGVAVLLAADDLMDTMRPARRQRAVADRGRQ
jgi:hypothetical protein